VQKYVTDPKGRWVTAAPGEGDPRSDPCRDPCAVSSRRGTGISLQSWSTLRGLGGLRRYKRFRSVVIWGCSTPAALLPYP